MLQLAAVFFPMEQCGSTFVYLCSHSRPFLEWMRKLDVCARGACGSVGGRLHKEIAEALPCHPMGLLDPIVNLEGRPLTF